MDDKGVKSDDGNHRKKWNRRWGSISDNGNHRKIEMASEGAKVMNDDGSV